MPEGQLGSKGELLLPREVRERLGLRPNEKVIYRVEDGRLVVEPVPRLEDVFGEHPAIEITLEDFHSCREELSKKAES